MSDTPEPDTTSEGDEPSFVLEEGMDEMLIRPNVEPEESEDEGEA